MKDDRPKLKINYFPGHMARALRKITETADQADAAVLVLDARAPLSSFPEGLEKLVESKTKIVVLSKPDLADPHKTKEFLEYFKKRGYVPFAVDLKDKKNGKAIQKFLSEVKTKRDNKFLKAGFPRPAVKFLILGIPNVGKSTLINILGSKNRAQTENKPGKTKRTTMFRVTERLWLFDTPGVLQPKVHDDDAMIKLALLGSIKEVLLPHDGLARCLIDILSETYPDVLAQRYKITKDVKGNEALQELAVNRKYLLAGGVPDVERAAQALINELRSGQLGRLTLDERPQ